MAEKRKPYPQVKTEDEDPTMEELVKMYSADKWRKRQKAQAAALRQPHAANVKAVKAMVSRVRKPK